MKLGRGGAGIDARYLYVCMYVLLERTWPTYYHCSNEMKEEGVNSRCFVCMYVLKEPWPTYCHCGSEVRGRF